MRMESGNPSFWSLFTADAPSAKKSEAPSFWSLFANEELAQEGKTSLPGLAASREVPPPSCQVFDPNQMFWAMRNLPVTEALKHFAITGATGSGKSTIIQLFLQSIAPRFKPGFGQPEQLIVFDGKCDAVTQLASLGFYPEDDNVYILNPHDVRCAVWDISEGSPLMARHLASLLVPAEPRSSAPFFWESARDLIYAVILGLNRAETKWTFRDLICALDTKERILAITARDQRAKYISKRIFDDDKHGFGVLSSLAAKIVKFEQVAALWHSAKNAKKFTIEKFLEKPGVLILGDDATLHESLWPINALLLKALTQEILRRTDTRQPRHWFVLDEFPAMERVDCIHDLLRRGRSKGASVLLGTQGLEALEGIYEANATEDILAQCANKTFLRAGAPKTAEWAERFFGKVRNTESSWSESWSKDGRSFSTQYHTAERSLFLSSTFLDLPFPVRGGSLISINDVPYFRSAFITRRWFDEVLASLLPKSTIPAVLPRLSVDEQTLEEWSPPEEKLFTEATKSKRKKKTTTATKPKKPGGAPYLPSSNRRRPGKLPPEF